MIDYSCGILWFYEFYRKFLESIVNLILKVFLFCGFYIGWLIYYYKFKLGRDYEAT